MKNIILFILLFAGVELMFSCSTQSNIANKRISNESYIKYLSSVVNDTNFFEIPELKIVDSSIYPILDSLLLWSEKCKYFDNLVKDLYSFRFEVKPEKDKFLYSANAHLSPAQAIGLILVEAGIINKIENIGIFYYKHHLFVIPMANYRDQKELEYFPFVKQLDKKLKIRAPKFLEERVYDSYIDFIKLNDGYKIINKEICGYQILIR